MTVVVPSAMASVVMVLPTGTVSILIVSAALCFGVAKGKYNDHAQQ